MKAIIRYFHEEEIPAIWHFTTLPILDMNIHGAPHDRQHRAVIQKYREDLYETAYESLKIQLPIDYPIFLKVLFTNPNSPDTDHTYTALCQALDGKTLKGSSILTDDRWIQGALINKFWPNKPNKRDGAR